MVESYIHSVREHADGNPNSELSPSLFTSQDFVPGSMALELRGECIRSRQTPLLLPGRRRRRSEYFKSCLFPRYPRQQLP